MSNIGFMRNTTNYIVALFNHYMQNKKKYPSAVEKEDYKNFIWQMQRLKCYGEIEDEKEYNELMKKLAKHNLLEVTKIRNGKE